MPEFTTAVKNFLYNYLGDEANPVPFGGRDDALACEKYTIHGRLSKLSLPGGRNVCGAVRLLLRPGFADRFPEDTAQNRFMDAKTM